MNYLWLFSLTFCFASWVAQGDAAVVLLGGPGVVINYHQPIQAVIVDANGNTFEQTVCYDSAIGGVNLNTAWAGPNASVYFPAYRTGYIWNNGYWVDQTGFYWNGERRVYMSHPNWNNHWAGYWQGHPHGGVYHSGPDVSVHVHETVHNTYYNGHQGGHHHH